jgi:hopene-associated glycosyltransferase HpnB
VRAPQEQDSHPIVVRNSGAAGSVLWQASLDIGCRDVAIVIEIDDAVLSAVLLQPFKDTTALLVSSVSAGKTPTQNSPGTTRRRAIAFLVAFPYTSPSGCRGGGLSSPGMRSPCRRHNKKMFLTLAAVTTAIWTWLLLGHGWFWLSGPTLDRDAVPGRRLRVTAVIPARDEAEHILPTLESLLAQQFPGELRIVLVDDNSSDGTGELAAQLAGEDGRLRVVRGEPLPRGWTGKMWAVAQGLRQPEARTADYVLLTDADIVHAPAHLAALAAKAERDGLGLVSEMVRLRCQSLPERATIPAFVFFFQMLYPFRRVAKRSRGTAAAAGGTMLLTRAALDAVNGVDRIRGALIDDVSLAREVRDAGFDLWLGHAEDAVSARRYPSFAGVWSMIARTAYVQLRNSPLLLLATMVGMLLLYAFPVAFAVAGTGWVRALGIAAWAMMATALQPTLRRCHCSPLWGLALPPIALFYLAATCGSAVRFYQGRGGQWKNREYPGTPTN